MFGRSREFWVGSAKGEKGGQEDGRRTLKALRRLGGAREVDELLASERAKLAEVKGRVDRRHA